MIILYILFGFFVATLTHMVWKYSYWIRRKVKGPMALPIVGNSLDSFLLKRSFCLILDDIYKKYENAAYVGTYQVGKPNLLIKDLDLVRAILSESFNHFPDNEFGVDENIDPLLSASPGFAIGTKWKARRNQISPAFTAAKLKAIFPSIQETGTNFVKYLNQKLENDFIEFDTKNIAYRFIIANVAVSLFSLEANAFADQESEFAHYSRRLFDTSFGQSYRLILLVLFPKLSELFKKPLLHEETNRWYRAIIGQILERRTAGERRNDLFQALYDSSYSDTELIGHSFTFLLNGMESSSITLAYALFEIAYHMDVQEKLRLEIDAVMDETNGQWTEESFSKLTYLDKVIFESMRKNSTVLALGKMCKKSYQLPPQYSGDKTAHTIEPGVAVYIPLYSIHNDPKIYPNPHIFDPSRFDEDKVNGRHKYAFLGFGEGPRSCIGIKFAILQMKMALVSIVSAFIVLPSSTNKLPLKIAPTAVMMDCGHDIYVKLKKRS